MSRKRRLWIIIGMGIVITVVVGLIAFRLTLVCCALPPTPPTQTALALRATASLIVALNQTTEAFIHETETNTFQGGMWLTVTPKPFPYDPTLYAQRRHEEQILQTAAGPTQYAIFFATETALAATYQGTVLPTSTPRPTDTTRTATPTSASSHDSNCAFSWAHQDLPEIAKAAQEAFNTLSVAKFEVLRADAYGENCNRADGSTSTFAAMTTDFYLSVNVSDLADSNQLAQMVMTAYGVLTELKVKLPAQRGYLDMVFASGGQEKHFRAMFNQVKSAIEAGKQGTALMEAGGRLR